MCTSLHRRYVSDSALISEVVGKLRRASLWISGFQARDRARKLGSNLEVSPVSSSQRRSYAVVDVIDSVLNSCRRSCKLNTLHWRLAILSPRLLLSFCLVLLPVLCLGQDRPKTSAVPKTCPVTSPRCNPSCRHSPILQNHPTVSFGLGRTAYGPLFQRRERG
jgi:hypothetical protein